MVAESSSSLNDFVGSRARPVAVSHREVRWDLKRLRVEATVPAPQDASVAELLALAGVDPNLVSEVTGLRVWEQAPGVWLHHLNCKVRSSSRRLPDLDAEVARFAKAAKAPKDVTAVAGKALVVALADWQAGKGEGGGSEALLGRVTRLTEALKTQVKADRPGVLVLAGLGDMVEGCSGHYAEQAYGVDLDRRDQEKLARRLILHIIEQLSPFVPEVQVLAVPGNHGENRQGGKSFTSYWHDNSDLSVFETAAEVVEASGKYPHVSFFLADALELAHPVAGGILGLTHGHGRDRTDVGKWWGQMALARQPVGEADLLLSGHYHHLHITEKYGRPWLQAPALDGGSAWWLSKTGQSSPPGILTFGFGSYYPSMYGDVRVHV